MSAPVRQTTKALILAFSDLPFEGLTLKTIVNFKDLDRPEDEADPLLLPIFQSPIELEGSIVPIASKVDVRGVFRTKLSVICDRCNSDFQILVEGSLDTFLMARSQFSAHDKPGGKVIHPPTGELEPSRHRSRTKAVVLSDADGEHEDESFGAFDGKTVDLRPILRELLILQIPMKLVCSADCRGLCQSCGGNINRGLCTCQKGAKEVGTDREDTSLLATEIKNKLNSEIQVKNRRKIF